MTDRDAAVTGEREEALRLARKIIRDPMPGDGEVLELSRALLAEAARADALEAELRLALKQRDAIMAMVQAERPPEEVFAFFRELHGLSPSKLTEGDGDA